MTVSAPIATEAIDLDLSALTSILAVVLAIGAVVMLVWMWRIGHQLEGAPAATDESGGAVDADADLPTR